jgi:predicted PurR-regulated permease PerM
MMPRQTFSIILIISVLLFCCSSFSSPPVGWRLVGLFLGPMLLADAIAAFEIYREEFREEERQCS